MKFVNVNGDIILNNAEGHPVRVASVRYGITYGFMDERIKSVTRVTIEPGHNDLTDIFIFYSQSKVPFMHIQSRELNPCLKQIYAAYIVNKNDAGYSIEEFITKVVTEYFIESCGYTLRKELIPKDEVILQSIKAE